MGSVDETVRVYQELAKWYGQQGVAQMRDRFLVLAADTVFTAGRNEEAERLRSRLLQVNPHHLFKPFASLGEAMKSADVKNYIEGLRRTYPPEKAAQLLESVRSGKDENAVAAGSPRPMTETLRPGSPPLPSQPENLKVLRFQDENEGAPKASPVRNAPASRPAEPAFQPLPARSSPLWSEPEPPSPWRRGPVDPDRFEATAGAWVANTLFWLVLSVGIALAIFTLGGPFLPI
jgi:hypothetical protein